MANENEIKKKNMEQFKRTHVELNAVHLESELMIPITADKAAFILNELKKTQVLKKILNKKPLIYRKGDTVKRLAPPLRENEVLIEIRLEDVNYSSTVFYNRQQVIKYINLWMKLDLKTKSKRTLKAQAQTQSKLEMEGWSLIDDTKNVQDSEDGLNNFNF